MNSSNSNGSAQKCVCKRIAGMISNRNSPARRTPHHREPQADLLKTVRLREQMKESGWVPITFGDTSTAKMKNQHKSKPEKLPTRKSTMKIGVKDSQKSEVDDTFDEYIDRAGSRIRAASSVGAPKPSTGKDSFNDRVSDYINRAKLKFSAPSFPEGTDWKQRS